MSKLIKLTQGKTAIVDDEDYEWLNQWKWHACKDPRNWYAKISNWGEEGVTMRMHRLILSARYNEQVDHRNHNGLDNRRSNIRIATKDQNNRNRLPNVKGSSKFKGVSFYKPRRKWVARIGINNHIIHLGYFHNEAEAAKTYDVAAINNFGEFAMTNAQIFGEI